MYKNIDTDVNISKESAKLDRGGGCVAGAGYITQRHGLGLTYLKPKLVIMILFNSLTLLL
jgi:hypothetical protein